MKKKYLFCILLFVFSLFIFEIVSSSIVCKQNSATYSHETKTENKRNLDFRSPNFSEIANFSISVWTEDLNYNITCFNQTGGVVAQFLRGAPDFDSRDSEDKINRETKNCSANSVYVFVREGGKIREDEKIGYRVNISFIECRDSNLICEEKLIEYVNNTNTSKIARRLNFTSPTYSKPVAFNVSVWTEDLNYNITCFNQTGGVVAQFLRGAPKFDSTDGDDRVNRETKTCLANKVYVFVREGGDTSKLPIGYSVKYVLSECHTLTPRSCECNFVGCGEGEYESYWCDGCNYTINFSCKYSLDIFWADLAFGEPITNISRGGTALIIIGGKGLEETVLNISVAEKPRGGIFRWLNIFGFRHWRELQKISNIPYFLFKTSDEDNVEAYIARGRINGTTIEENTNELIVLSPTNSNQQNQNILPFTNITSPRNNYNTSVGCPIEFTHDSYDEDDLLKIVWDFGDGNQTIAARNYSKVLSEEGIGNINYTYKNPGRYKVVLTVEEEDLRRINRNLPVNSSINVEVFEEGGIRFFPVIVSPKNSETGNVFLFNASDSYILNCSRNITNPVFTIGERVCGRLNCSYILAPGDRKPRTGKVFIRWKYSEDEKRSWRFICPLNEQNCNDAGENWKGLEWNETNYNQMGGVVFWRVFVEPKKRWIVLEMNYEAS